MKILALDTATEQCSVALWVDGGIREQTRDTAREHAQLVLGMIDQLLVDAGLRLSSLDAIAFGRGPGSFTGVRLAAAVTQGLAFAADLPVLPISNLRALALQGGRLATDADRVLCCMDARMGEVYTALFAIPAGEESVADLPVGAEEVLRPSVVRLPVLAANRVVGIGRGFSVYPALRDLATQGWAALDDMALPHARDVARLAALDFRAGRAVAASAALPVYLRNNVVTQP